MDAATSYVAGILNAYRTWGTSPGDTISQFGTTQLRAPISWLGGSVPLIYGDGFLAQLDAATG